MPAATNAETQSTSLQAILNASTERDIDAAFVDIVQRRAGALIISGDPFFDSRREQLVKLAASNRVPVIYQWREFATLGADLRKSPRPAGEPAHRQAPASAHISPPPSGIPRQHCDLRQSPLH
jgi:hypothetical protein